MIETGLHGGGLAGVAAEMDRLQMAIGGADFA